MPEILDVHAKNKFGRGYDVEMQSQSFDGLSGFHMS